jgi:hypothetical protein
MKLGTLKRIDRQDLAKGGGDIPKWIDALLDPLNQFIEKVGNTLQNGVTFEDNVLCKIVRLQFTHDVDQSINPFPTGARNLSVKGVIPIDSGGLSVDKFKWARNDDRSIDVNFNFDGGTSATKAWCSLIILLG